MCRFVAHTQKRRVKYIVCAASTLTIQLLHGAITVRPNTFQYNIVLYKVLQYYSMDNLERSFGFFLALDIQMTPNNRLCAKQLWSTISEGLGLFLGC